MESKQLNMVCLSENDERPQVAQTVLQVEETDVYNLHWQCNHPELVEVLPEGDHINVTYYRDNICRAIDQHAQTKSLLKANRLAS